jgi:alpha-L-arabinofuranosidase
VIAGQDSLYASACIDEKNNELIIKLVNVADKQQSYTIALEDAKPAATQASVTVLQSDERTSVNSFEQPQYVFPIASLIKIPGKKIPLDIAPYSFTIVKIKL